MLVLTFLMVTMKVMALFWIVCAKWLVKKVETLPVSLFSCLFPFISSPLLCTPLHCTPFHSTTPNLTFCLYNACCSAIYQFYWIPKDPKFVLDFSRKVLIRLNLSRCVMCICICEQFFSFVSVCGCMYVFCVVESMNSRSKNEMAIQDATSLSTILLRSILPTFLRM